MDIIQLLRRQHAEIDQLFAAAIVGDGGERLACFEKLVRAIAVHFALEERVFYPACRHARMTPQLRNALHDHRRIKRMLVDTVENEEEGLIFGVRLRALALEVTRHEREEEAGLFELAGSRLPLEQLSDEIERLDTQLRSGAEDPLPNLWRDPEAPGP